MFWEHEWVWAAVAASAAFCSLPIAILALRQSAKALRVDIPAPDIHWLGNESVTVRVHGDDERRFGISEIRAVGGTFQNTEYWVDTQDGDNRPSIRPGGPKLSKVRYKPPVPLLTLYAHVKQGGGAKVRIVSRADTSVGTWMYFPK